MSIYNPPQSGIPIGGTVTGGTTGSVLFINPSATLAQDNAGLFYDDTNNRLGLTTTSPTSRLDVTTNSIGTTIVDTAGITLSNTTAATALLNQYSPGIVWSSQSWKTGGTPASQNVKFRLHNQTANGTTTGFGTLLLQTSVNNGAYTTLANFNSSGSIVFNSGQAVSVTGTLNTVTISNSSSIATGAITVSSNASINNVFFTGILADFNSLSSLYYNHTNANLIVGNYDTPFLAPPDTQGTLHGKSIAEQTVPTPSGFSASLVNVGTGADVSSPSATQVPGRLYPPGNFAMAQDGAGTFYTANGSTYDAQIWSYDGTAWSVISSAYSFTDNNDGLPFQIDYTWDVPAVGTVIDYKIQLSINGTPVGYYQTGNVNLYIDDTGSYPDSAPSPLYDDYGDTASPATRNYAASAIYTSPHTPSGTYYSQTPSTYSVSITNDGNPYRIEHSLANPGGGNDVRVVGNPDGTSSDQHFDATVGGGGTFLESSGSWTAGNTVTPISYGYHSDGSLLTNDFTLYSYKDFSGTKVYSLSAGTVSTTDPNDGNYYEVDFTYTASASYPDIKVVSTGGISGALLTSGSPAYADYFSSWANSASVSPTAYVQPAGYFEKDTASITDTPTVVIKSLSVSSPIPYINFINSSNTSLGKIGTDTGGIILNRGIYLPYTAVTATYAVTTDDSTIDCTSGTFTVTLPTAAGISGRQYTIKNSGAGTITVATTGGETIDGAGSYSLSVQYQTITIQSDSTNWIIIGKV